MMEASKIANPIPLNDSSSGKKSSVVQMVPDAANRIMEMAVYAVQGRGLGDLDSFGRPG